ncbi:DNA/RNA helicase domain-containing protein [Sanguibacter sp. A247]|uniref:DNA/RNA helicase domain-containing protein n=1 Tax=unclassified Sanguibacter TaxID=2645534 RepID=UPI003FD7D956
MSVTSVRLTAAQIVELSASGTSELERVLAEYLRSQGIGAGGASESRSWRNSLPRLARDLSDAGLGSIEMLVEQRLPLTSKRADVVLAGVDRVTGAPRYVVVELKQWAEATTMPDAENLVTVPGTAYRQSLHPSVQVGGYVDYLRDFLAILGPHNPDAATIGGLAYLHNATRRSVDSLYDHAHVRDFPLFTGDGRAELVEHLRRAFAPEPGIEAADAFARSAVAPSKQLLALAADEVREREQFVLLDEQRVAFDLVLRAVERSRRGDVKSAVVITGGPGSGKSVIALALLGELARQERAVLHATGSRSFTQTLRKVVGHRAPRVRTLFTYFNSFMQAERNGLDVLVCDEAHRIRETSVSRYTPKVVRESARLQVDELFDAARVPVFLLDEHQVVRPGEQGAVADIRAAAARRGIDVVQVDLDAEFRAGGSLAYIEWVRRLLGLAPGGPLPWHDEPSFSVDVVDSPHEMEARLRAKLAAGHGARMTAGYCWPWSDPVDGVGLVPDVRIGDWVRPWNVKGDRGIGSAPPSALWATADGGFEQVGCVYTAQGFEYGWNGVILGPDLVWRGDRFVARREQNRDPDFRSRTRVPDDEFDRLVRNVYKVLLTRGMEGTYLFSVDPETQEMLRRLAGR